MSGTPLVAGSATFVVRVTDSANPSATATAQMVLAVGGFDVVIEGRVTPDLWTGSSYRIRSPGGTLPVTFQFVRSAGGSTFTEADSAGHAATYVTGTGTGEDLVLASRSSGEWTEVPLEVMADPAPNQAARFGTSDVWFVRFDGKEDATHVFASDFDHSLSQLGLRAPTSTDVRGTDADLYARFYVRQNVLSRLDEHFLNAPDGTPLPAGLEISFVTEEPVYPHLAPADGMQDPVMPGAYNVIGVEAGVADAMWLGYSFFDDAINDHVESATPLPGGMHRGVFVDGLLSMLGPAFFSASLGANPVSAADVPALRALVYGLPSPGGRYDEIQRVADGWANVLSIWLAHEIGHCLSLYHTGGIMLIDANWLATPGASPVFIASDLAILNAALPGFGR